MPVTWADEDSIMGSPRNPSFAPPTPQQVVRINELRQKIITLENKVAFLSAQNMELASNRPQKHQLENDEIGNLKQQLRESEAKILDLETKLVDNEIYFEESMKRMETAKGVKFVKFDGERMRELEEENKRQKEEIEELEEKLRMEMERKLDPKELESLKMELRKNYSDQEMMAKNMKIEELEFEISLLKKKATVSKLQVHAENLTLKTELEEAKESIKNLSDELNTVTLENKRRREIDNRENDEEKRILRGYNEDLEKTVQLLKQW